MSEKPDQNATPGKSGGNGGRKVAWGVATALAIALIVLLVVILPSEYGVDPTGIGGAMGLTALSEPAGRTIQITDVIGGNERIREIELPDAGEPAPLPNPAIHQLEQQQPRTETLRITIPAESQTEVKTVMRAAKVITYSWQLDQGTIYVDYHGHDPALGDDFWVRYQEAEEISGAHGSLVAPFDGEHGWYWLNYNEFPVEITLSVTGYFDEIRDYGIF
jgi:hypothetical protein